MTGRLITLEGGEGAGKSTAAAMVRQWLTENGRQTLQTREPGGSTLAEAIRGLVLADWPEGVNATTETLLMFAARAAHLQTTIRPALASDIDVICDRFIDASWAYQGAGRGVAAVHLQHLEDWVLADTQPTLTLLFDIAPELGLPRAKARGDGNRFEAEAIAFQEKVRAAYLQRAHAAPQRYAIIDAAQPLAAVQQAVFLALSTRL